MPWFLRCRSHRALPCTWTCTFNHVAYGTRHASQAYHRRRHKGMVTAIVAIAWSVLDPRSTNACACRSKHTGARLFLLCERPLMSRYASLQNMSAAHSRRCNQAFFHCRCGIAWGGTANTSIWTIRLVDLPHAAIASQVCKEEGCRKIKQICSAEPMCTAAEHHDRVRACQQTTYSRHHTHTHSHSQSQQGKHRWDTHKPTRWLKAFNAMLATITKLQDFVAPQSGIAVQTMECTEHMPPCADSVCSNLGFLA